MGARDVLNSNNSDLNAARADRQNRLNPPEFAPAQGDEDDDFFDDLFGDDSVSSNTTSPSLDIGGTTSPMTTGTFNGNLFGQQPTGNQQTATEDKIFDAVAQGGKETISFIKDFTQSLKGLTPKFWAKWGSNTFIVSLVVSLIGLILLLFKFGDVGFNFLVGGILSAGTGALLLMLNVEEAKLCNSEYVDESPTKDIGFTAQSEDSFEDFGEDFGEDMSDEFDDCDSDDDWDFDDSADDGTTYDSVEDEDDFFNNADELLSSAEPSQGVPVDTALQELVVPEKGMFTRQYLYETFTKVLDYIKPDFATIKTISEDSDVFIQWEIWLRDACTATGIKEEALPNLLRLEENLFTIKLTFDRPVGLKADLVADELATAYAYAGGEFNSRVYAKADVMGKSCMITIFTGETALISLKDMYQSVSDFMLNSKNYMPVVLGINPQGKVIAVDFKKLESILTTGMPRSGKSWFVQVVLTQLCVFVPPSELNIYICDPKEGISDFKAFRLPHVKKFVSGDDNIVNTLRSVVRDLAPKRKKIIGDAGFVNVWDYKERNPDVKMPIIYVLIDEVVTLAERMEKETKKEFQGLLVELISQLPALGIRAFLIPHVVKNDIIAKTATDLIPCRISVCGDAAHIESTTGTKPKEFPYKLTNKGDMAMKIPMVAPETMFVHGPALSDSNPRNNDIFEYLLKVWSKLEPDEVKNSVAAGFGIEEANNKALKSLSLEDDSDIDLNDLFSKQPTVTKSFNRYDNSVRVADTIEDEMDDSAFIGGMATNYAMSYNGTTGSVGDSSNSSDYDNSFDSFENDDYSSEDDFSQLNF